MCPICNKPFLFYFSNIGSHRETCVVRAPTKCMKTCMGEKLCENMYNAYVEVVYQIWSMFTRFSK